jgi:hypothetical protein
VTLDFDATPIDAHSEKEGGAGHYKGGFGFNPLPVSCGREVLAGILRPGNAGANNAADHLEALEPALEQLPQSALDGPILARADSAGASHQFVAACRECEIRFSLAYALTATVRDAILALPESTWQPALNSDGEPREGAWVTELTGRVSLDPWPEGTRLICCRERPHPGAQLTFTDHDGHRFQCFISDQHEADTALLEVLHREHAQVEDRVKTLKATGAAHLPFHAFDANAAWLELAFTAHDIMVFTQQLNPRRQAPPLRARTAAPPHPPHRRAAHPPRPPRHAAPPRRLALGPRDPARLQTPPSTPRLRLSHPLRPETSTPRRQPQAERRRKPTADPLKRSTRSVRLRSRSAGKSPSPRTHTQRHPQHHTSSPS